MQATIDHATDTTPDLRRIRRPLGPVAVFGARNLPGGGTAIRMPPNV